MSKLIIFGGTSEGRRIVEYCSNNFIEAVMCVATEYGEILVEPNSYVSVHSGPMDKDQIVEFLKREEAELVVDATHPYAEIVTANVKAACGDDYSYIRVIRNGSGFDTVRTKAFPRTEDAVEYLNTVEGNILLTTGSKTLGEYCNVIDWEKRVFARVLPLAKVAVEADKLGFRGKNLICMQGPFTTEINVATMKMLNISYLVTKDTGEEGGFPEKLKAAEETGAEVIVIGRPTSEDGVNVSQCIDIISEKWSVEESRIITIVGMGMGSEETMTIGAQRAIEDADAVIGAERLLKNPLLADKVSIAEIYADKVMEIIDAHKEWNNVAVIMSGDVGFYSGTTKLRGLIQGRRNYELKIISGISSVVYFSGLIGKPWQDVKLCSVHGRACNIVEMVKRNQNTFFLLGGQYGAEKLIDELTVNNLGNVEIYVGENLSYENERVKKGTALELQGEAFESLAVAFIVNKNTANYVITPGISDDDFIRGSVPMTKEEVRTLTVSKLRLTQNSVIYDIGAGTGSVSLECAKQAYDGKVIAIERNEEGCALIEENMKEIGISNIQIVKGEAPVKDKLPIPTHAFIGGSGGNMEESIQWLLEKNPSVRIVLNTVTLESQAEIMAVLKKLNINDFEAVTVNVARNKKAGKYNLMMAQNPVYIVSFTGGKEEA